MKSRFTNNFAFTIKAVFLLIDNNFCKSKSYLNYSDFHLHKCLLTHKTSEFIENYVNLIEVDKSLKFEHKERWNQLIREMK